MAIMNTDKDLAELYRRGRRTSNKITGRPENEKVECTAAKEQDTLERYKIGGPDERSDEYLYQELALIPFFAGMKSSIVATYRERINHWFWDYRKVAKYSEEEVKDMMADSKMFHNKKKIEAAIENAREFQRIRDLDEYGSFIKYIFHFNPQDSLDNLRDLMKDMHEHFIFFGPTVTKHYLMVIDIGLPIIKPDLNIMRTFYRIGLVDKDGDDEGSWAVAIMMAEAADVPVLWVDYLVSLGMESGREVCGHKTFCERPENPCEIRDLCDEWTRRHCER